MASFIVNSLSKHENQCEVKFFILLKFIKMGEEEEYVKKVW